MYVNISYMQMLGYTRIVQPRLLGLELSLAHFSTTPWEVLSIAESASFRMF